MNPVKEVLEKRGRGGPWGLASYCTSHPLVLEACMETVRDSGQVLLVEATANQVNQYGGYTGMEPKDFIRYIEEIAIRADFPRERLLAGGDHLGPLVWASEPEEKAMEKARVLVREFVLAGFAKIHLDTSMRLGDDSRENPLSTEVIARRGAILYGEALRAYEERKALQPEAIRPVFVIGSEVPIPGGSQEGEDTVAVTRPEDFADTVETYRRVFAEVGYPDAFQDILAVVVQPGVEFGENSVHEYNRRAARELTESLKQYPGLVFEGHSTDYQSQEALRQMAEDGIAILKVGPALTFALREALFQLESMERELVPEGARSHLAAVLDWVMVQEPENWEKHYHGKEKELALARKYSYSDRCRYYIGKTEVEEAIERLLKNLERWKPAMSMLHQYMPVQYQRVRRGILTDKPRELLKDAVARVVEQYQRAVGAQ